MEKRAEWTSQGLRQALDFEQPALTAAQRLAALDPDIRIALSEVWWAGLRVGLAIAGDSPLSLPGDPFGARAMEQAGFRSPDF